jgi:hypothetical protein
LHAFGQVSVGNLKLILSGPRASGSRPMPDGRHQEPGGWNRVVLLVQGLPERIADLKKQGVRFRNEMEVGPGGRQIQVKILMAIQLSCSSLHGLLDNAVLFILTFKDIHRQNRKRLFLVNTLALIRTTSFLHRFSQNQEDLQALSAFPCTAGIFATTLKRLSTA